MIAYDNRATQEITPAATIIALNLTVVALMNYIFTEMVVACMYSITTSDTIFRIPALLALMISFYIVRPLALKELKQCYLDEEIEEVLIPSDSFGNASPNDSQRSENKVSYISVDLEGPNFSPTY